MLTVSSALLTALVAVAWLGVAVAATIVAVRRSAEAKAAGERADFMAALLAAAPTVPLLAYADGRIAFGPRAAAWLGLERAPDHIDGLVEAGFEPEQIATMRAAIEATVSAAKPFALTLPLPGSTRQLALTGSAIAMPGSSERAALIWIGDVSEAQASIDRLTRDSDRLSLALDGLSGLIEAAPFPIWHRGTDNRLALVNESYVRAVEGADPGDVVRRGLELFEGDGGDWVEERGSRTRVAPAIVGGERRMMRVVEVPVPMVGVAGFAIDAQELEDVRTTLRSFEEAQRAMLDRLSAGVAQFGPDHALSFHNLHFRHLFNLDRDALEDQPEFDAVFERMRESERMPATRDFRSWRAERRAWFNAAEAVEESWMLPGRIHLRVVAQPLPDGGLLVIFEDRTEHLELASARDTLLRVRSATFDNLFEAVGVFAADGRLHLWNNRFRELWELEEEALLAHPHLDALVKAIQPRLIDPKQATLIRELVRVATVDRRHRTGRVALRDGRYFEFAAVPLPDGNALFTLLDVTASHGIEEVLRTRNEALEETNQQRGGFVARMSYELRVPLTSIAGFAEMLAGGYAGELAPAARDYVEAILRAVDRLQELIGDALDLSQSEMGALPIASEAIDIGELVRETARLAADSALAAGVKLSIEVSPRSGMVAGDRRRLRRCLDHLVRNALAHTPPDGQVLIRSRELAEWSEIIVSDNGVGIPPEETVYLMEEGGHSALPGSEPARRTRLKRGVGLPLARQLVHAHGGTMRLDSEVGRGTDVIIHLPLVMKDV